MDESGVEDIFLSNWTVDRKEVPISSDIMERVSRRFCLRDYNEVSVSTALCPLILKTVRR